MNIALERVIRILNLCARKWRDEQKRPWLDVVPMITKLEEKKTRRMPYPMSWEDQSFLFAKLPDHLRRMALYKVNSGSREQEVVKLRWDWEIPIPELNTSVFLIPADFGGQHESSGVKNGDEHLVVLNNVAKSVMKGQRGLDPVWVFPYGQHDRNGKARSSNKSKGDPGQSRYGDSCLEHLTRPKTRNQPGIEQGGDDHPGDVQCEQTTIVMR